VYYDEFRIKIYTNLHQWAELIHITLPMGRLTRPTIIFKTLFKL
jgi:hypothetical protein